MADYNAEPLWSDDPNDPGRGEMIGYDPDLHLCADTLIRLESWVELYERIDWPYLETCDEWTEAEKERFDQAGVRLWLDLRRELGSRFQVAFHSEKLGRTVEEPEELGMSSWLYIDDLQLSLAAESE
jgi:hypothetical protein